MKPAIIVAAALLISLIAAAVIFIASRRGRKSADSRDRDGGVQSMLPPYKRRARTAADRAKKDRDGNL